MVVGAGCDGAGSTARDGGGDAARDGGKSGGRSGNDAGAGSGGSVAATGGTGTTGTGGNSGGIAGGTGGGAGQGEGGVVGTGGAAAGGRSGSGGAITSTGGATASTGGAGGVTAGTGGRGMTGAGERPGTGGMSGTGGAVATGGATTGTGTGGAGTGGAGTGGANTGGANTGTGTGGAGTGGANTGGANTGGANTGGANTGGANTGGANTGGAATGGRGTGGAGTGGAGTGGAAPGTGGVGGGAGASLYVVAHPDDDLLFINPFIETDIQAGRRVTTVYVTSGDGSDGPFPNREPRIMSAGAAMGGVADNWNCATHTYAGKSVKSCSLAAKPLVGAIFLRLLDGQVMSLRSGARVNTADGATSYDEAELLATLQAIIVDVQPGRVGTLDASMLDNGDVEHTDHVASAIYALDAARSDGVARQLLLFRGYTTYFDPQPPAHEPQNLSTADYNEKRRVMVVYLDDDDSAASTYDNWLRRTYAYTSASPATVSLQHGSQCLEPAADTAGSAVHMAACNGASAGQDWSLGANSRVVGVGGLCLGTSGSAAVLQNCDNSAGQRWTLMSNGQLRGTRVSCLDVSGTTVSSADCGGVFDSASKSVPIAAQRWTAVP